MKGKRYLVLKGRTWWFHRAIPERLRAEFGGRKTVTWSLNTSDYHIAQGRRDLAFAKSETEFKAAAEVPQRSGPRDRVTTAGLGWAEERRQWREDPVAWAKRVMMRGDEDIDEEEMLTPDDIMDDEADRIEREHGRAERNRFLALAFGAAPIDQHLEAHLSECGLSDRAVQERRTAVKRLMDWSPDLTLSSLNRTRAGLYVTEVLAPGHPKTSNKAISNIRSYWRWLQDRGHVKDNPWERQRVDGRRSARETVPERPFTDQEVATLLWSPWPSSMRASDSQRLHDAMRIAALSGMRIEEICQLTVADCAGGTFNIRRAKTKAGVRRVPIHSQLEEVVQRRATGKRSSEYLFGELGPEDGKERSAPLSKQFSRYRTSLGVDDHRNGQRRSLVNFHSFRRWFITKAERAGQPPHIFEAVVGHKRPGLSLSVYSGGPSVEDQMKRCVEAVQLPTRQD